MKMRSYNFCHTNTKNPGNNLGIFCLITGRPKLNGYRITIEAHEGQKDLDGKPEILHPLAVGLAGTNREEVITGFLHDVVEDSKLTLSDLRKKGVDEDVIIALKLLTHDKSKSTYEEYINKIALSGNTIAIHVKYNDLRNNLQRGLAGNHMKQVRKHEAALRIIEPLIKD